MKPEQFLESIYLGDRACKAVLVDGWRKRVGIQVDVISRLKPGAKKWEFDSADDIRDAWLVFSHVKSIQFNPSGPVPNDIVNKIEAKQMDSQDTQTSYLFEVSISSVDDIGKSTEVFVRILADQIHLEDPARPGLIINT